MPTNEETEIRRAVDANDFTQKQRRLGMPERVIIVATNKAHDAAFAAYQAMRIVSSPVNEATMREVLRSAAASVLEAAHNAYFNSAQFKPRTDLAVDEANRAFTAAALAAAEAACAIQVVSSVTSYHEIVRNVSLVAAVAAREAQRAGVSQAAVSIAGALAGAAFYSPDVVARMKHAVKLQKRNPTVTEEEVLGLSEKLKDNLRRLVAKVSKEYYKEFLDYCSPDSDDDNLNPQPKIYEQKIAVTCMALLVLDKKATLEHLRATQRRNPRYNEETGLFRSTTEKLVEKVIQTVRELGIEMEPSEKQTIIRSTPDC